jgi:peptidoglycan hydrolase CwlO-like protein
MSTTPSSILQNPDPGEAYQELFDYLGRAYWEASDIETKDLLHGTQEAVGEIITAIDEQALTANTALFVQLTPKIKAINANLNKIKGEIASITKNINTATSIVAAITRVLSLFPAMA